MTSRRAEIDATRHDQISFTSLQDAQNFVLNSGLVEWGWGGAASVDGFAEYLFFNSTKIDPRNYGTELHEYLISVGEDPTTFE